MELKEIPIADIRVQSNIRLGNLRNIDSLAESIRNEGLLQPVLVKPNGDGYILVDGHRRFEAYKEAYGWVEGGTATIPTMVSDTLTDDADRIIAQVSANLERDDLTAYEIAQAALDLKDAGMTQKQIASRLSLPTQQVSKLQKIAKAVPEDKGEQANLLSGESLVQLTEHAETAEEMSRAIDSIVNGNARTVYQALHGARDAISKEAFLAEVEPRVNQLREQGVKVLDAWPAKATPIKVEPKEGIYSDLNPFKLDIKAHRKEPCHIIMFGTYSHRLRFVEGCSAPSNHLEKDATVKAQEVPSNVLTDDEKAKRKEEREAKRAKEAKVGEYLNLKLKQADLGPVYQLAWREMISHNLAVTMLRILKAQGVEVTKVGRSYSPDETDQVETLIKHVEDRYAVERTRLEYVSRMVVGNLWIAGWANTNEAGTIIEGVLP